MIIELGNVAPHQAEEGLYTVHQAGDGDAAHHHHFGDERGSGRAMAHAGDVNVTRELNPLVSHMTVVDVPDEHDADRVALEVVNLWPHHSGDVPSFVACDDEDVRRAVMDVFGLTDPKGPLALYLNGGRDWVSQQVLGAAVAAATNQGKYVALTANTSSPAASDTTLTGEIATASGGLIRAAGTVAHTTGASTSTVSNTFTVNGNDSLPVDVAKAGLFNAASTGTMIFETLFAAVAALRAVGDSLALTWTINH